MKQSVTGPDALSPLTATVDASNGANQQITMGVWNPADYTGDDPKLVTSVAWGNWPATANAAQRQQSIVAFDYNDGGPNANGRWRQDTVASIGDDLAAQMGEVGSTWGLAARSTSEIYAAAVNKWGVDIGPGGRGAIYKLATGNDPSVITPADVFTTIPDIGDNGPTPLATADSTLPNVPTREAFFKGIGKSGLGDMDLSEDGKTLYVVDLYTRSLVSVPINADGTAGQQSSIAIPDPGCPADLDWRPWGLGVHDGGIYVGGVCSGESTNSSDDLEIVVYKVAADSISFGVPMVMTSLPSGRSRMVDVNPAGGDWRAWDDTDPTHLRPGGVFGYSTPLVSDIEVTEGGDLVLGMVNRASMQYGWYASGVRGGNHTFDGGGGDIVRLCAGSGNTLPVAQGDPCSRPKQTGYAEDRDSVEYYVGDYYLGLHHWETSLGGISYLYGKQAVLSTAIDPERIWSNGVRWLDNTTGRNFGDATGKNVEFQSSDAGASYVGFFGKANAMGDLTAIASGVIQIGNYVWIDANKNGVQDPDEQPVARATVSLYAADANGKPTGNVIATVKTGSKGEYYFDSISHGLEPDTEYVVSLDNPADYADGGVLHGYSPTVHDTGAAGSAGAQVNDSNGVPSTDPTRRIPGGSVGFPDAPVTTGGWGRNDHTIDFGFYLNQPSVDIEKGDDEENDADTPDLAVGYTPGESRGITFNVTNNGTESLQNVTITDRTISGATVESLVCKFPGDDSATAGTKTDGLWAVRWDASWNDKAVWERGETFECHATLTMAGNAAPHADAAEVDASVEGSGDPVHDRDDYHAFTGQIQIIKYDDREGTFTPVQDAAGIPNKPLSSESERDANTADEAVVYRIDQEGTSTGGQRVEFAVTNTGSTWLTMVNVSDLTLVGPDLQGLTCDFTAAGDQAAPTSGTTWVGPWAPGSTFYCEGTVELAAGQTHGDGATVDAVVVPPAPNPSYDPSDPDSDPFTDQPSLDGNGDPVRSTITVTDKDPFHAETTQADVAIVKGDTGTGGDINAPIVNDADTPPDAAGYAPSETRTIRFDVTNTGTDKLKNVVVTDSTITGGQITGMQCVFPGETQPTAGVLVGTTWTVAWAATHTSPPTALWEPEFTFTCEARLLVLGNAADMHRNTSEVAAIPASGGDPVRDDNDYNAFSGQISIIKWDGRDQGPADGSDEAKSTLDPAVDADDEAHAVEYELVDGAPNTGTKPVKWIVTNTGTSPLANLVVTDAVNTGPALTDVTCTFPDENTPTEGVFDSNTGTWTISWAASATNLGDIAPTVFEVGDSFTCEGNVTLNDGETHADTSKVVGSITNPTTKRVTDITVTDDDPFNAKTYRNSIVIQKEGRGGTLWYDANTEDTATVYPLDSSSPIRFRAANTGTEALSNVSLSDKTLAGDTLTDLVCVFPGETTPVPAVYDSNSKEWTIQFTGAWSPNAVIECNAAVRLTSGEPIHGDEVTITADAPNGHGTLTETDQFWAKSADISATTFDARGGFLPESAGPLSGAGVARDANSAEDAITYMVSASKTSTGPHKVGFVTTNSGLSALSYIQVSPDTKRGPQLENLTCDFSSLGGPATGTEWEGTWNPGDSFNCSAELTLDASKDSTRTYEGGIQVTAAALLTGGVADADATPRVADAPSPADPAAKLGVARSATTAVQPSNVERLVVGASDPFYAKVLTQEEVKLAKTGSDLAGAGIAVLGLFGLGGILLLIRRKRRAEITS
ncbi:SdrD B-like domain-containing protein [Leifsonia sp. NPDC058248]|uniref:SdrD B-like domain-containing protein n=1 Tax=Leifsonia sp. NPDC058248 TaxID=3346402 RepID=UPI0036D980A3